MKKIILILVISLAFISYSQTPFSAEYEVEPGVKGNQIKLTIANVSETDAIQNVNINLLRSSSSVNFRNQTEIIELIEPQKERTITFTFDINRNAPVNNKDTIDFTITDQNRIPLSGMKSFIINYTPPKDYKLEQNFPNPFNPVTTIQYQLPVESKVSLKVYDILGSEIATLVNEVQEAGYKEVRLNAEYYASGIYVYRLITDNPSGRSGYISTKKMMLLK
ncbi:MAG: T9SS type A sorting domain-containing protein [Ignavibacteriaceae bacterium]